MFQIGPFELLVLAVVGLLVLGPERLPGYAKQAAQLLRTLRELATGAQQQLRDELGPEFADVDLANLNPKTVVRRAIFDEDFDFDSLDFRKRAGRALAADDLRSADPRVLLRDDDVPARATRVSMSKPVSAPVSRPVPPPTPGAGLGVPQADVNGASRPRPRPSPRPRPNHDDVT